MSEYITLSLSGGKDSTAMLLRMIELNEHIDEVINCDTGMEFPQMYEHLNRLYDIIRDNGIKLTILKNEKSFEYLMKEIPVKSEKYGDHYGYGWPSMNARWCTKHLKTKLIGDYTKKIREEHDEVIHCVGLAADEIKRLEREQNRYHRHPLVEWGWDEKQCLHYCYERGFDWGGLYETFKRVSCWCCPLQPLPELKKLWWNYPELWHKLEEWEVELTKENIGKRGAYRFKNEISVFDLNARFSIEMKRECMGLSNNKPSKELKAISRDIPKNQQLLDVTI